MYYGEGKYWYIVGEQGHVYYGWGHPVTRQDGSSGNKFAVIFLPILFIIVHDYFPQLPAFKSKVSFHFGNAVSFVIIGIVPFFLRFTIQIKFIFYLFDCQGEIFLRSSQASTLRNYW